MTGPQLWGWIGVIVTAMVCIGRTSAAEFKLGALFSDKMVLQREQPIRIWGHADANADVQIVFGDDRVTAQANSEGRWIATLKPAPAGGPHELRAISGDRGITLKDVVVGDVFLCSGQSNMQLALRDADGSAEAIKSARQLRNVRLMLVPKAVAPQPKDQLDAAWADCTPESAAGFSAVAFFFAEALRDDPALAHVPIGLIDSSFGGTCVEGWISSSTLAGSYRPQDLKDSLFGIKPAHLHNAMIAPLAPGNLKAVLWYQGESNAPRPELYDRLLSTLIEEWRSKFQQPGLPFFVVQLPNYPGLIEGSSFVWIREAQAKVAASVPSTYMAVTIDTPDGVDLHPKAKRMVGQRLALLARRHLYGQSVVSSGPIFRRASVEGEQIRIEFDTAGSALKPGGVEPLAGFTIAGDDGVYRSAIARIDGNAVVVRSEHVPAPRTVRYAWSADPRASVFNEAGLPAAPFRTDSAPIHPIVEALPTPTVRRVATAKYTVTLDGDGTIAGLLVGSEQMLSNDSPGFMLIGFFGTARQMFYAEDIGPDCVRYTDKAAAVRYEFKESEISIHIRNDTSEPIPARLQMSPRVKLADAVATPREAKEPVVLSRGKSTLTINGIDKIASPSGSMLELIVEVPAGAERTLSLHADAQQ